MQAFLKLDHVTLEVPTFLQRERDEHNWLAMLMGAAFDPPQRRMHRLLNDISFEAREGDRIGLLGINGAGKSTLLRVLNAVYVPSSGMVQISGSCQALLNMGLGFNNEATVRENIFLRGSAMGMKTALIRELFASIVAFSGLEEKISHRLGTLSAGQRLRLGFAISTAMQHDIMLMDEWVGAGDAQFMEKAKDRLLNRVAGSKIVVLATHNLGLLQQVCNRALVLDKGHLVFDGPIKDAITAYHAIVSKLQAERKDAGERLETVGSLDALAFDGNRIRLRGWALRGFIEMPSVLVVEIAGQRYPITDFNRHERPGVQHHFGLSHALCGFEAELDIPGLEQLPCHGSSLQLYAGAEIHDLDGPIPPTSLAKTQLAGRMARAAV